MLFCFAVGWLAPRAQGGARDEGGSEAKGQGVDPRPAPLERFVFDYVRYAVTGHTWELRLIAGEVCGHPLSREFLS